MKDEDTQHPLPAVGSVVATACKGTIRYEKNVPTLVYKGQRLFFCLPTCKRSFQYDPNTSCLAGDPLLDNQ
jgi:YHS domain-containing protein